ncbi:hypothetical protein DLE60_05330 [Micromonospora globispora]|uniref:hypothetical protein n=1 Tax=Micromonospora globispora TaxID=1450148 RepID=UPI000D6F5E42|nr:hypothetical protein [Micromonospora globispora]PWU61500.1 hypothetical protein DLE60_05330 [Micromonospora globispora]
MNEKLNQLAVLLRARDDLDARIAALTGRSARPGDVGEFIAAQVFDIELADTAVQAGYDGIFRSGPLAGRTVNVKIYGDAFTGIDIGPHRCDYYLVLSGPPRPLGAVRHHRWQISAVYLFDTLRLLETLTARGVKIGIATSIRKADLEAAQIFPATKPNAPIRLTAEQAALLSLFAEDTHRRLQRPSATTGKGGASSRTGSSPGDSPA